MEMNGKKIARITLNAALALCAGLGTVLTATRLGLAMTVSFFTIQSNLLCLLMALITVKRETPKRDAGNGPYVLFKGMALIAILLTFIVYNFVLKPYLNTTTQTKSAGLANNLQHVIVPLMTLGDYLFFEKKGLLKATHPLAWALFPLFYLGYTAVYKAFGGLYDFLGNAAVKFPYFFLDYETYGLKTTGIWVLLIAIGFIGSSYLLFGLDRVLARARKTKALQ
jgi:hypothetical protein